MSDRDALLTAILADPDDDTARLVFADWLQENGQPLRSEFIRAQIEAVRADPFGPASRKAERRAAEILEEYRPAWTRHLNGRGLVEFPGFERGFISRLAIEPVSFVNQIETLFTTEPVQALKLYRFASSMPERVSLEPLFELPRLRQVRGLELSPHILDADEYEAMSDCSHLDDVRELSLRVNPVPPAWLERTLRGDRFPNLTGLDLSEVSHVGRALAATIPAANHRKLKRLNLSGVAFNSDQIQKVLCSRCLREVEELRLACVTRSDDAGPLFHLDLGFVIPWDRLVVLDLARQGLGDAGVREIVGEKSAASLRWLGLASNRIGPDSVRYLTSSKYLALNHLDVRGNNLTLADLAALHQRFPDAVIES